MAKKHPTDRLDEETLRKIVKRVHDLMYVDVQPIGEGRCYLVITPDKSIEGADFIADVAQIMFENGLHPKKVTKL